ncbi:MAG: endonuclease/exonuclease/phosphatase family protein [Deltaproteobacteria bacterium]|nr:endonuclease/exonuclease/phosphatase family protein [Deltaproteobacteria bacterium]
MPGIIPLKEPFDLDHRLQPVVPEIRKFRTRKALLASGLWKAHGLELERVADGIEYWLNPEPVRRPSRPFVRVAAWNIERGKRLEAVFGGLGHELLQSADVLILNEADIGMARSGQRNIARLAAERMGMHYVFGNHYLCLDRGNPRDTLMLGKDGTVIGARGNLPDEENSLGLHGNAILTHFPVLCAENLPLHETKDKFRSSEKRFGVKKALWADIGTPHGPLTVGAVHLDSMASPARRARQLDDLLSRLNGVRAGKPVIVGGDWNTSTYDLQSPLHLAWNLLKKFLRGGFAHAVPSYMTPYEIYDREIFETAVRNGFAWREFNNLAQSTSLYDVDDPEAANIVRDQVGLIGVKLLRWRLAPWNGKAPLKVDWFSGRNLSPAGPEPASGALAPLVLERFRPGGRKASDHDPVIADIRW